jgi:hypothetical protein
MQLLRASLKSQARLFRWQPFSNQLMQRRELPSEQQTKPKQPVPRHLKLKKQNQPSPIIEIANERMSATRLKTLNQAIAKTVTIRTVTQ